MQFKVPQFIDVEDKVVGPLTFKQFAYLAGGGGLVYLSFRLLPIFIALPIAGAIGALAIALAFIKYNEKPFVHVVEAFIKFYTKSRLYLWRKQPQKKQASTQPAAIQPFNRSALTDSKLKTLSWSLDVIETNKNQEK